MIRSMSGYGSGSAREDGVQVAFEVRAVNHRFCHISLHLPSELSFFEDAARQRVRERIHRGKVDVSATLSTSADGEGVRVDRELAEAYVRDLRRVGEELGLPGDLDLATVAALPGVVSEEGVVELDPDEHEAVVSAALGSALDAVQAMRCQEGGHLAEDLRERFETMDELTREVAATADELPSRYRDRLIGRMETLMEDVPGELDEGRLAQEVAHLVDRADITEELVRVDSHLQKAMELLESEDPVGRSLEFLVQELHREVNTIGSKARELEVAEAVVALKGEIEKVREQVQNVE